MFWNCVWGYKRGSEPDLVLFGPPSKIVSHPLHPPTCHSFLCGFLPPWSQGGHCSFSNLLEFLQLGKNGVICDYIICLLRDKLLPLLWCVCFGKPIKVQWPFHAIFFVGHYYCFVMGFLGACRLQSHDLHCNGKNKPKLTKEWLEDCRCFNHLLSGSCMKKAGRDQHWCGWTYPYVLHKWRIACSSQWAPSSPMIAVSRTQWNKINEIGTMYHVIAVSNHRDHIS